MARYSEAMKAAWAKKTPEERSARGRELALRRWKKLEVEGTSEAVEIKLKKIEDQPENI